MKLYSTKDRQHVVDLREAVFRGLPPDNGLYMPVELPTLAPSFLSSLRDFSLVEIGYEVCRSLFGDYIPESDLRQLLEQSLTFPAPLVQLDDHYHVLELFHGPSLAFKDFGARFMAQLMSYFNRGEDQKLIILVATSGDTGGAVAAGFHQAEGIEVVILYPKDKVSALQQKQLTTLGGNVRALEIEGTFDDCQALVKQAFLDEPLRGKLRLSSANSINIARLIPQSFYYFEAFKQLPDPKAPAVFCVPSGNFGNLTAGLFAVQMGLPIQHFIAATNRNDVVPTYLQTNRYRPRPSVRTLSNAMDVGRPSNFARMVDLYGHRGAIQEIMESAVWQSMRSRISGFAFNDAQTEAAIQEIAARYEYTMDPHGAVGYLALKAFFETHPEYVGVLLETAHPAKFLPDVERILNRSIEVPDRLAELADRKEDKLELTTAYEPFRSFLLENYL